MATKPQYESCHPYAKDPTLSGRDAESFINHACAALRSIYGHTPDNLPDPRLSSAPLPQLSSCVQGLYFPEPLQIRQPTVSWYVANLAYYARASAGVFHTAIAYLERAQPRFTPVPSDPRTAFVAALVLAHRFLEDGSYKTETWARLSGTSAKMISACVEAMFDALEHRLWLGPLPAPAQNTMFSMREGTIFSEEVLGGQRRCSLPSLSVLYGAGRVDRTFGDPQSASVNAAASAAEPPIAGPSTATATTTAATATKPVQCLPSPPDSPFSASGTPPPPRPTKNQPVRRVISVPETAPAPLVSDTAPGNFNYTEWQAGGQTSVQRSAVSLPPPPAPHPHIQHPHPQYHLPPPPLYTIPRIVQPDESPVFDAAQWCAPAREPRLEAMDVDVSPTSTPPATDAFNPLVWASQGALITPAPTVQIGPGCVRYPRATLMPPAALDPVFHGRRHSH
ncbi:hypothetical protein FRC10_002633 [Ceratobasidium sp. 414]|nr:hypothetical protein FRC10_002633 [Ceratobasidium sp. 414]